MDVQVFIDKFNSILNGSYDFLTSFFNLFASVYYYIPRLLISNFSYLPSSISSVLIALVCTLETFLIWKVLALFISSIKVW